MQSINDFKFLLMASLTLGLAPFLPEPHIIGKVQWLIGGAHGMKPMDWFDLVLHGTPWILLFRVIIIKVVKYINGSPKNLIK